MDAYPTGSLDHNVPFVIVSGLNNSQADLPIDNELKDQAILLRSEQPIVESRDAKALEEYFKQVDTKGRSWVGVEREEPFRLQIKTIGRV